MAQDNAASRLLDLLIKAKSIDPNTASIHAWEQLLGAKNNPALLLSRMGKMIALPEQISTTLTNSTETTPGVVQHISNQLYAAFTTHKFSEKWELFINRIDTHMTNYLALASTLLETQIKTKKLDKDELQELREGFVKLLEEVRSSDLPPRLKSYVVLQLHDLVSVLDNYFITGAEPILERIEATIGHAYIDNEYKEFLKDHELGKSLLGCLGAAANLVTVAVGIPQLTQIIQLLQHGG
ncbi:hypothetical protein SAMN05216229_103116 [Geopseudomonas sagittaria]|uniref:Uncharacterized protein n=1 Tax=Geopseudomonas sagittaria TaxID=1135990 RepID=A0A1I5R2F4_9GAMM|nr:hypothetical protein [Pseudomonas sagittaria]SFP52521.1 hypothetical protein SAMN05216229_103116 [Pseudomonas sagittaria]